MTKVKIYKISRILLILSIISTTFAALLYKTYIHDPSYLEWFFPVLAIPSFGFALGAIALPIYGLVSSTDDKSIDTHQNTSLFTATVLAGFLIIFVLLVRMFIGNHFGAFGGNGPDNHPDAQKYKNDYEVMVSTFLSMVIMLALPVAAIIHQNKLVKATFGNNSEEASKLTSESSTASVVEGRIHKNVWDILVTFFILRTIIPVVIAAISLPLAEHLANQLSITDRHFDELNMIPVFLFFMTALFSMLALFAAPYLTFLLTKNNSEKNPISSSTIIILNIIAWYGVLYALINVADTFTNIDVPGGILLALMGFGSLLGLIGFIVILITFVQLNNLENSVPKTGSKTVSTNSTGKRQTGGIA